MQCAQTLQPAMACCPLPQKVHSTSQLHSQTFHMSCQGTLSYLHVQVTSWRLMAAVAWQGWRLPPAAGLHPQDAASSVSGTEPCCPVAGWLASQHAASRRSIAQQLETCPSLPQTASHQTQQEQVPCCCPQSPSSVAPACCRLVSGPAKRYRHAASGRSAAQQQQAQQPHAIIPNIVAVLHGLFPEMEDKVGRRRTLRILQTCIQGRPRLKVLQAAPRRRHPALTQMVAMTLATQRRVQKWWLCCDRLHLCCGSLKLCCSTAAQSCCIC